MSTDAAWALQSALYAQLADDTALALLIGSPARIYDAVPDGAVLPLLQIGAVRMAPYPGVKGGQEHMVRLNAFSRYGGRKEAKAIAAAVRGVLQDAAFPLEDHALVQSRLVFEDHLRFRDPDMFQAAMRYRMVTVPQAVHP